MEEKRTVKKIPGKELTWYIIAGVIGLTGLVFLVFGIIGSHFPGLASDNWIAISEAAWLTNWSHMGYRWWGLILIGVAVILAAIVLNVFAKTGDRDEERALRRQQRLAATQEAEVVPVESTEVKEEPKAEEKPIEETKVEEPVVEEPKAEEKPIEETKVEEPKAEEPVIEEKPAEEPVKEETPVEEVKAEEVPAEEPKAEETPAEEPKAE